MSRQWNGYSPQKAKKSAPRPARKAGPPGWDKPGGPTHTPYGPPGFGQPGGPTGGPNPYGHMPGGMNLDFSGLKSYADAASAAQGAQSNINAPGVGGGGVPTAPGIPVNTAMQNEYNANKGTIDQVYADNAAKLKQLQDQYNATAGQIGQSIQGDYKVARGSVGGEAKGLNADLAAQGVANDPVRAQQQLQNTEIGDAMARQKALLGQDQLLAAQSFADRGASAGNSQAAFQSQLLQAFNQAKADAAAAAADGGGGGGGGGYGHGGGSGDPKDLSRSDFGYARDVANITYGGDYRDKFQHNYLSGQSFNSPHQQRLRAALHALRGHPDEGVAQNLLQRYSKKDGKKYVNPRLHQFIAGWLSATHKGESKKRYANAKQVNTVGKSMFGDRWG